MQQKILIKLYGRARAEAIRSGFPEEANDFAAWYAVKLLEGTRQNSTIGQCFIDYLREERGNEKRGRKRYRLNHALRASDFEGSESGNNEEAFSRVVASSGHFEAHDPEARLLKQERERRAVGAIKDRSERELLRLYREGWELGEIGQLHGYTASRASQRLAKIALKLKAKGVQLEPGDVPGERPHPNSAARLAFKF